MSDELFTDLGVIDPDERYAIEYHFYNRVRTGTIVSATNEITVISGTDASPSSRLSGSPSISGTTVSQVVAFPLINVTYHLRVIATTSTNQIHVGAGRFTATKK